METNTISMKVITINTPEGQYQINLQTVAEDRAEYYSERDEFERDSMEWKDEIDYVLGDTFEGIDWIINNSDWEDWEPIAKKVSDDIKTVDEDFWFDFEIIPI